MAKTAKMKRKGASHPPSCSRRTSKAKTRKGGMSRSRGATAAPSSSVEEHGKAMERCSAQRQSTEEHQDDGCHSDPEALLLFGAHDAGTSIAAGAQKQTLTALLRCTGIVGALHGNHPRPLYFSLMGSRERSRVREPTQPARRDGPPERKASNIPTAHRHYPAACSQMRERVDAQAGQLYCIAECGTGEVGCYRSDVALLH